MKNHGQHCTPLLSKIRLESYLRKLSTRTGGSARKLRAAAFLLIAALLSLSSAPGSPQDMIRSGTGVGQEKTRVAVPSFRVTPESAEVMKTFDDTLWNDLDNSGIIELVSRSFYPQQQPATPAEVFRTEMQKPPRGRKEIPVKVSDWARPPANAHMVAVGNGNVNGQQLTIQGWLVDPGNTTQPEVFGKQYQEEATKDGARIAAHRFADEIIFRLGGGIPGIAESKIAFIRRGGPRVKELWMMDYDGSNQKQITHLNATCLTPAISQDGTMVAFTRLEDNHILVYSMLTNKLLPFFNRNGLNTTPTWSPDGSQLAFTSSVTGDPEIYLGDSRGEHSKRLTFARGVDISPAWNPKTGNQIAFVSDRSGKPQIYTMDADGTNVTQVVNGGNQALDPAWSPNGRLLAFTWDAGGEYDIWLLDVASKQMVQMTKDLRRNEHPSWSPDNRHIVFQSNRTGVAEIWTMLADGSKPRQLTFQGENSEPVWSSK